MERELSEAEEALRAQTGDELLGDSQMLSDYKGDYEYKEAKTWEQWDIEASEQEGVGRRTENAKSPRRAR